MSDAPHRPHPFRRDGLGRRIAPFAAGALLALASLALPPTPDDPVEPLAAVALTALIATAVSLLPWSRLPRAAAAVPPLAYLGVIALLNGAHGGAVSAYAPLCMLPIFWIALHGSRHELAAALAGVAAVLITPLVLGSEPASEWRRALLWIGISALVGVTTQRLVALSRAQAVRSARDGAGIASVARVARELSSGADARMAVCQAAVDIGQAQIAELLEPDGEALVSTARAGVDVSHVRLVPGREPSGSVVAFSSGKPFFVEEAVAHPAVSQRMVEQTGAVSVLFQPILRRGEALGVLVVGWTHHVEALSQSVLPIIGLLADEAAVAIERGDLLTRLAAAARTDPLTGLPNRRTWDAEIGAELSRAKRRGTSLHVVMLDVDHFKKFNDANGHQAGDRLLKAAAAAWRRELREADMLARYGGDEFLLALPDCAPETVELIVDRLRSGTPDGQTCSAGIAPWDGEEPPRELIARADRALYEAKHAGRDRAVFAPAAGLR